MKISYTWLRKLLSFNESPEEVASLLTNSGLEVESLEKVELIKGGLQGLVVGEILETSKHPDADKLTLTTVDIGQTEFLHIVCGAPNVMKGQKVVVAPVGTTLYPLDGEPFQIKKSKIRGAVSEGMLCAEDEIGLGKNHDGILVLDNQAEKGTKVREYFNVTEDIVFEIGLTPNRGDAASHYGVARELATLLNCTKETENYSANIQVNEHLPEPSMTWEIKVEVEHRDACQRYCGIVLAGLKIQESPEWLKQTLSAVGIRPINNIVDVTNFVLHETGQPLHAFDAFKIEGKKVIVRGALQDEKIVLLDGSEKKLNENDLVICNEKEPMCLAGIFGGLESSVTNQTHAIFLESAYFKPDYIRKTSKAHGIKTDSSFRFERGTDPDMVCVALKRAVQLILEISGGSIATHMMDYYPVPLEPNRIAFSFKNCFDLIGKEIPKKKVKTILTSLGIKVVTEGSDGLLLDVPPFKSDVTREADVTEEILRIFGYNNIPASGRFNFSTSPSNSEFSFNLENRIAELLVSMGFNEIMNTSLSNSEYYTENVDQIVSVLNPISSELSVLRKNMLFSGLQTVSYNINHKNTDLKLFEFGRVYAKNSHETANFPFTESLKLSLFVTGRIFDENSSGLNIISDIGAMKAYINTILSRCGIENYKAEPIEHDDTFSYGLLLRQKKKTIGKIGKISKKTRLALDIKQDVYAAELDWELLKNCFLLNKIEFHEIPKFPSVRRDLALLLDKKITYSEIEEISFATERKLLKEVNLFDVYEGEKIDSSKKSYAISFVFQDSESTLTEQQIEKSIQKLIKIFGEKLNAQIR